MSELVVENIQENAPKSLDEVIAGLKGFGIEDFEEILTIKSGNREVHLRLSNIPTEDELNALIATEDCKGHLWVQTIKCEILSRAISYMEGVNLRTLPGDKRIVLDPKDGMQKDIQVVLRNLLMGWGQELVGVLWKVLMTHAQAIEERLINQFPDAALMTEYEKRFMEIALKEIEEQNKTVISETVAELYNPEVDGPIKGDS
jgi:hypothetical protein